MIEKLLYTSTEVKEIYAQLIERMGCDAEAVCNWPGVDGVSLKDWDEAWWQAFQDTCEFEKNQAKESYRLLVNEISKTLGTFK